VLPLLQRTSAKRERSMLKDRQLFSKGREPSKKTWTYCAGQVLVGVLEEREVPMRESDWMNRSGPAIVAALTFYE
jgi:hypothetical protein